MFFVLYKTKRSDDSLIYNQIYKILEMKWYSLAEINLSYYYINKKGSVKNRRNKILNGTTRSDGYIKYQLRDDDGNIHNYTGHSLVASIFIGKRPKGYVINHKNHIRDDNRAKNLEYITQKKNRAHANQKTVDKGRHRPIIQYTKKYEQIRRWNSIKEASETLEICHKAISRVCREKAKTAGGYIFEYEDQVLLDGEDWVILKMGGHKIGASTKGRICTHDGRIIYGHVYSDGYLGVSIGNKKFSVHRIIYIAFNGEIEDGYTVDHIDRDRTNNCLDNLRIATAKEQANNRKEAKRNNGTPVYQLDDEGEIINEFESLNEASRAVGVTAQNIGKVCLGQRKKAAGFGWKYAN